jgi:hypothetical protein
VSCYAASSGTVFCRARSTELWRLLFTHQVATEVEDYREILIALRTSGLTYIFIIAKPNIVQIHRYVILHVTPCCIFWYNVFFLCSIILYCHAVWRFLG